LAANPESQSYQRYPSSEREDADEPRSWLRRRSVPTIRCDASIARGIIPFSVVCIYRSYSFISIILGSSVADQVLGPRGE
jgi:hypothetical protein